MLEGKAPSPGRGTRWKPDHIWGDGILGAVTRGAAERGWWTRYAQTGACHMQLVPARAPHHHRVPGGGGGG